VDQFNLADYATPITDFLEGNDVDLLTDAAKKLTEGDLVALAWRNQTKRTEKLGVRDLVSIEQAFSNHSFRGRADSDLVGSSCCCTCTPACCCTAVSVTEPLDGDELA